MAREIPINPLLEEARDKLIGLGDYRGAVGQLTACANGLNSAVDRLTNETQAAILGSQGLTEEQKQQTVQLVALSFAKLRAMASEWGKQARTLGNELADRETSAMARVRLLDRKLSSNRVLRAFRAAARELRG